MGKRSVPGKRCKSSEMGESLEYLSNKETSMALTAKQEGESGGFCRSWWGFVLFIVCNEKSWATSDISPTQQLIFITINPQLKPLHFSSSA